jgi:hypothetical protein
MIWWSSNIQILVCELLSLLDDGGSIHFLYGIDDFKENFASSIPNDITTINHLLEDMQANINIPSNSYLI